MDPVIAACERAGVSPQPPVLLFLLFCRLDELDNRNDQVAGNGRDDRYFRTTLY
jgi:hypothetical protein